MAEQNPGWSGDAQSFYHEFTLRNAGFISDKEQQRLRQAHILIAGCGSTGGSVIEVLVRSGAEQLALADNGSYELNNANRQNMVLTDVGRSKVDVFHERMSQINPFVQIDGYANGITPDNVDALVEWADVIIDAVDVTGRSGLEMKFLLHEVAHRNQKAVVCGYDMAAAQYVPVFDYRDGTLPLMAGLLNAEDVATLDPLQACARLIPDEFIPLEMFDELARHQEGKDYTSQLCLAANLFGVLGSTLVLDILNERAVETDNYVDLWSLMRKPQASDDQARDEAAVSELRSGLRAWANGPGGDSDPFFLERSLRHYQLPLMPELHNYRDQLLTERAGISAFAIPHEQLAGPLARQLLRFAFVHYARVGFINPDQAARRLLHHEPLSNLSPQDVHLVLIDTQSSQLLGYSTLKAPLSDNLPFSSTERPHYGVEQAFGRDLFAGVDELQGIPVAAVREIGRVTKAELDDPVLNARVGIMLLSAYRQVVSDSRYGISAFVGDGEKNVTLRNLTFFGFNPQLLPARESCLPADHLYHHRYVGRDVRPFWLLLADINQARADEVEALLDLDDNALLAALNASRSNAAKELEAQL